MALDAGSIFVKVQADTRGFNRGMVSVSGRMKSLGKVAAVAGAGIAGGLVWGFKKSIQSANDHSVALAQTNAVIKSTRGLARVTAKDVLRLSDSIEKTTGVDDLATQSAENLLLTFTNVRNEVGKNNDIFTQATKSAVDMSVALGQDTKSSAIQLGKALNDPIKGVTALRRVGVSFTKAQLDQIKALVKSGKTLEAQKLILRELNTEFGGSAEAVGKTLPGRLNILKARLDDVAQSVGERLTPVLIHVVDWVEAHWPQISKVILTAFNAVADWTRRNWPEIKQRIIDAFNAAKPIVEGFGKAAWDALQLLGQAIKIAVPLVIWLVKKADAVVESVGGWKGAFEVALGAWLFVKLASLTGAISGKGGLLPALKLVARNWKISLALVGAAVIAAALIKLQEKINELSGPSTFAGAGKGKGIRSLGHGVGYDPKSGRYLNIGKGSSPGIAPILSAKDAAKQLGIPVGKLPHMAKGGVATRPTLAMIGERGPEAVVPLSGGRGIRQSLTVNLNVDGRTLARVVLPELQVLASSRSASTRGRYGGQNLALA